METPVPEPVSISPEPVRKNKIIMLLMLGLGALLVVLCAVGYVLYETGNLNDRYILEWKDVVEPNVRVEKTAAGEELVINRHAILHSAMIVKDTKTEVVGNTLHIRTSLRMHLPFEQRCDGVHMMCDMELFNTSRVALPEGVDRVVFGNEETLIWEREAESQAPSVSRTEDDSSVSDARSKAIEIAEREVRKNFPDMKRSGVSLVTEGPKQWASNPSRWTVTYDAPLTLDAQVVITVDVSTGEVVEYQDSWS